MVYPQADDTLQQLLRMPSVAEAMKDIVADPRAIEKYSDSPEVMEAIERLNSMLKS